MLLLMTMESDLELQKWSSHRRKPAGRATAALSGADLVFVDIGKIYLIDPPEFGNLTS